MLPAVLQASVRSAVSLNAPAEIAAAHNSPSAGLLTTFSLLLLYTVPQAFEKSGVSLDAPAETIAEVLKYHVVKGDKNIPAGFTSGAPVATLQGQDITVTFVE
jgi:uncharacterized surface protein with fasciclin (FAS1) repeats